MADIIKGPFDLFQSGPDMESYEKYQYSGNTYTMTKDKTISQKIANYITEKPFNFYSASIC